MLSIFSGFIPRSEIADSYGNSVFSKELPNCFPKWLHYSTASLAIHDLEFLHSLTNTCYYLLYFSHPSGGEVISHAFDLHFAND